MTTQSNETPAEGVKLSEKFLRGDLINALVQEIKLLPVAWSMMTEKQQGEVIDRLTARVDYAIEQAVAIIAADGRATLVGSLVKVQIKDGIQVQVNLNKDDPLRHELIDSQGKSVLLVVGGSEQFKAGDPPKPDPDQVSLLDDGAPD